MDGQLEANIDALPSGASVLTINGEVDLAVVHDLAAAFEKACASEPTELVVDIAGMTYCDSAGVAQFITASTMCSNDGRPMRIIGVTPMVRRVFEVCGLAQMLGGVRDRAPISVQE